MLSESLWLAFQSLRFLVVAASLALAIPAHAGDDEVAALLERHGMRPVEPPSAATDFRLPTLTGETASLSDAHGRWVVLTFFATWCGPCATEMPTLQKLHEQRRDRGVDVVAVALEDDRSKVQAFARSKFLTFPIFMDGSGQVGAMYHASSIPVTYLIDPAGRIVAVSRGARDWAAHSMTGLIDRLLALIPPDPKASSLYAAGGGAVELPSNIVPPTAEVIVANPTPGVGRPFNVDVRIRWAGHIDDYILHPPSIQLPESVTLTGTSARTSSEAGAQVITYRLSLVASEPGSFALDPVEVRYTPRFESKPVAGRITGPTIEVVEMTVLRLPPAVFALGVLAVILLCAVGIAVVRRRLAMRPVATGNDGGSSYEELRGALENARKHRVDGNVAQFLETLAAVEQKIDGGSTNGSSDPLADMVERARYGGQLPANDELDQLQRRVERRLGELRADTQAQARQAVRLNDARE
ncbi:MAG: TlpA disulfide reductase family protein [Myxococcota bacterium]